MGFGIALIGYAFMLFTGSGVEIVASLMLGYGFFLASRLNAKFMGAAISALFILPRGIVNGLTVLGIFNIDNHPLISTATFLVYLMGWMMMSYFWLMAVIEIARENSATKLENQARNRMVFTLAFIFFVIVARVLPMFSGIGITGSFAAIEFILQYIVIFVNIFFLHTCFVLITSEEQYERDKQQIAKERADALEKKYKKQQEVSNRFGKRKK